MAHSATLPGGTEPGDVYLQEEYCGRMRLGRKAFMALRRKGLPVRKIGRRIYVDSDEAREWLRSQPKLGATT